MLQAFASLATGIGTSETGNTGVLKREKFMNCKKVRAELRESVILDSRAVVLLSFFFFLFHYRETCGSSLWPNLIQTEQ